MLWPAGRVCSDGLSVLRPARPLCFVSFWCCQGFTRQTKGAEHSSTRGFYCTRDSKLCSCCRALVRHLEMTRSHETTTLLSEGARELCGIFKAATFVRLPNTTVKCGKRCTMTVVCGKFAPVPEHHGIYSVRFTVDTGVCGNNVVRTQFFFL